MFQKIEKEKSGYQLYDFGNHYELHSRFGIYRGNLKQVATYAVTELGFEVDEIELGVLEMNKQFHNGAEFGIMRRFMYTFDKETNAKLH